MLKVESQDKRAKHGNKRQDQLKQAFSGFLAAFLMVYHQNGQQTISLNGDRAEAVLLPGNTLVGKQNDKEMKTTFMLFIKILC